MFKLFDMYRKENTNPTEGKYCDVDFLLRFWRENKGQYLAPLFGDKLILEKEVEYERGRDQLRDDMYDILKNFWGFSHAFEKAMIQNTIHTNDDKLFSTVLDNISGSLRNSNSMIDNELYIGYTDHYDEHCQWTYDDIKSYTFEFKNGRKIQVQKGMKITRAMTQLCANCGMSDEWEQFRIKHSQVLNQKRLKGKLCLSIHPLDYATASDNDNGWSSCMSWREEGCYRLGTVEMMNSPMVICAYLKSEKQHMVIGDDEWNSKKWRAWIIVNKDVILCNRHYPYHQETFAVKAIEWVRDLVGEKYGWKYEDIHTDFVKFCEETDRPVEFRTNYMYNDIGGDDVIGCFRQGAKMRNLPGVINFSGPAECMVCGDEIMPEVQEADTLMCGDCHTYAHCEECGDELDEDQCFTGPDGLTYCEDCYNRLFRDCENCGCVHETEESYEVTIPFDKDAWNKWMMETFGSTNPPDTSHPLYSVWYRHHWNVGCSMNSIWLCPECAEKAKVVPLHYNHSDFYVPDPEQHDMTSAYDLVNPERWHWSNHVRDISWCDEEDYTIADGTKKMYEVIWEGFVQKFFPNLKVDKK